MSVVTSQARRRWLAVTAGVVLLACVPAASTAATGALARRAAAPDPRALVREAVRSEGVAYRGLATSRGNLGVPDLPAIGDVPARLGGSTDTRVWWGGPRNWRVDVLSATGEQGVYGGDGVLTLWDYERDLLTRTTDDAPVRLPRADDLLPPQAARRMLGGIGARDRVSGLPARRIAGVVADGVRVTPAPGDSTIGHLDVWIEPKHHLPVEFTVVDVHGVTALGSRFVELHFGMPDAAVLREPAAPGAERRVEFAPDLVARIQRFGYFVQLPGRLAGQPSTAPVAGGAATYGSGLTRFLVLPIPQRLAGRVVRAAVDGGGVSSTLPTGQSVAFSSGAISLVVAERYTERAYVLAGLVRPELLTRAAAELVAQ